MSETLVHRLRVRYNECDAQGIVFNANYFTYFDVAVTELFRAAIGSYERLFEFDVDLVVAEASARYLAPARFDEEIDVRIAPVRLGRSSMVSESVVSREGTDLVQGRLVHIFVGLGGQASREIPDPVRRSLQRFLLAPRAPAAAPAAQALRR